MNTTNVQMQYDERADPRLTGVDDVDLDVRLYRRMRFIRRFEESLLELFEQGTLNGTTHCCIGQEADAVGVIDHLGPDDHVFSNHRCHGHYLASTGDARGLLLEIMGSAAGVCGGVGGSQHLRADGFASNGVLGGTVPNAAGVALANQLDGTNALSVVFIGDGTLAEGVVYETLNLASLWQLPLLIVCEDNGWAQSTPKTVNLAGSVAARFAAFGIPVDELDSTDVRAIHDLAEEVVAATRQDGPRALVIDTYRLCHHSKNDDNRPLAEVAARWESDPLTVHGRRLDALDRAHVDREVDDAIGEVIADARGTT